MKPSDDLQAQVGRAIVEGYRRIPPDAELDELAGWALRASIAEEPW